MADLRVAMSGVVTGGLLVDQMVEMWADLMVAMSVDVMDEKSVVEKVDMMVDG